MLFIKSLKQRFMKFFVFAMPLILFMAFLAYIHISHPNMAISMSSFLHQFQYLFLIFRWMVIGSLALFWKKLIQHVAIRSQWPYEKMIFWQSQRNRLMGWLIVIELVVCENVLIQFSKIF